jgi:cell division protein FtsX
MTLPRLLRPRTLRRQITARPFTVLGLVATLVGAGITGINLTVVDGRYELRLTRAVDQSLQECDAVYARMYGEKLREWNDATQ